MVGIVPAADERRRLVSAPMTGKSYEREVSRRYMIRESLANIIFAERKRTSKAAWRLRTVEATYAT